MSVIDSFIAPVIKVFVLLAIFSIVLIIVIRASYILWTTKYKWISKYRKNPYNETDISTLVELSKTMSRAQIEISLLTNGVSMNKRNEYLYLYDKLLEFKGISGDLNGKKECE